MVPSGVAISASSTLTVPDRLLSTLPRCGCDRGEEHVERHRAAVQVQGREIGQVAFEMLHVQRSRVDGEGGAGVSASGSVRPSTSMRVPLTSAESVGANRRSAERRSGT